VHDGSGPSPTSTTWSWVIWLAQRSKFTGMLAEVMFAGVASVSTKRPGFSVFLPRDVQRQGRLVADESPALIDGGFVSSVAAPTRRPLPPRTARAPRRSPAPDAGPTLAAMAARHPART